MEQMEEIGFAVLEESDLVMFFYLESAPQSACRSGWKVGGDGGKHDAIFDHQEVFIDILLLQIWSVFSSVFPESYI